MPSESQDTFRLDVAEPLLAAPGRRLGDFELVEVIGRGSYAEVWRARQRGLAREVAVKVLHERYLARSGVGARFTREADLASRLDHPYAAHVYAVGVEDDGTRWFAMELVRGVTLARLVELRGRMEVPAFLAVMERLGEVVQAAHELGLVHRDIKPANILVRSVGGRLLPKLMDFGLARLSADGGDRLDSAGATPDDPTLTARGVLLGSPAFMAPEQWADAATVGPAADQYALAVVGWTLLTGTVPLVAPTLAELRRLHRDVEPPPLGPGFPEALDTALRRALAKDAAARWPDVSAFVRALRDATRPAGRPDELPTLDPVRRERALRTLPTPLAEALARVADATTVPAVGAALRLAARVHLRWIGVLVLALRPTLRSLDGPTAADVVLTRLGRGRLADQGWAELIREQLTPWTTLAEACPLPELVSLAPGMAHAGVLDTLVGVVGASDDDLPAALTALEAALDALVFLGDACLVSVSATSERAWVGVRRREPTVGEPTTGAGAWVGLQDRDGALILRLSPLVEVAAPGPGAPPELFLFEGPGRSGSNAVAWPAGYERVLASVGVESAGEGANTSAFTSVGVEDPRPPWPGLDPWDRDDDRRFVGRERELEAVLNRLRDTGLLAVVGASGAGKSSFLRAGVLQALPDGWEAFVLRPGRAPLTALATAIGLEPGMDARILADPDALGLALAARQGAGVCVLAVDQLEELVTQSPPEEAAAFAVALVRAVGPRVRVVATLRDDFLVRVGAVGPLSSALSGATFLLDTPDRLTLARILVEPLRLRGYALEERGLAERIAADLQGRPAALSLLSFACTRLWDRRDPTRRVVPTGVYDALGGVAGMVARHAEATWATLPPTEQAATRAVFGALFTSTGARTRASRQALTALATSADRALEAFAAARLVVVDEHAGVEVAHEALLAVWPRLADWHRELAAQARFREHLGEAARRWDDRGRPRGLLWRDEALAELRVWRRHGMDSLGEPDAAFAGACEDEDRRMVAGERRRRVLLLLALALVIATLGGLYRRAASAETDATRQAAETRARLVQLWTDRARQLLGDDPYRALVYLDAAVQSGTDGMDTGAAAARVHTLAGAAWAAIPRSVRHTEVPMASARPEDGGRRGVFVTRDGAAWSVDADGRSHPPAFPGDTGAACGGALHLRDLDDQHRALAFADGTPVPDPMLPRAQVTACLGGDPLLGGAVPRWELRDGATGERRWSVDTRDGSIAWLLGLVGGAEDPRLVLGYDDGVVEVVAPVTGARRAFPAPRRFQVRGEVDPTGRRVAVWGAGRGGLEVLDLATGRPEWSVPAECGPGRGRFTADGSRLLVLDAACGLRELDAATGEVRREIPAQRGQAAQLYLTDDRMVVTAGGTWETFDLATGMRMAEWHLPTAVGYAVVGDEVWWVAPDGVGHRASLEDVNVGVPGAPERVCDTWVGDPAGRRWACLVEHQGGDEAHVWADGAWVGSLRRGPAGLGRTLPAFERDGPRLAFGGDGPAAWVWTPGEDPRALPAEGNAHVRVARFSPDGKTVASGGSRDEVRFHDVDTGEVLRVVPMGSLPFGMAWAPDGRSLAVGLADGTVALLDPATGARTEAPGRHPSYTKTVAWDATGARLASGSGDGTVIVRGGTTSTFRVGYPVLDLQLGPGPLVTVSGFGNPVQVWEPTEGVLVADLGADAIGAWVSADGSRVRYVRDHHWQTWAPEPWPGSVEAFAERVRCFVPMQLVGSQVVERTERPEGCDAERAGAAVGPG